MNMKMTIENKILSINGKVFSTINHDIPEGIYKLSWKYQIRVPSFIEVNGGEYSIVAEDFEDIHKFQEVVNLLRICENTGELCTLVVK